VVEWVRDEFATELAREFHWRGHPSARGFESPIEALFFAWWQALRRMQHITFGTYLAPQEDVACGDRRYRVDFRVMPEMMRAKSWERDGVPTPRICVELDGHDFHERTKEQVIYRNQRDRDLQADGWLVLHYSGSEIVRDPIDVIADCDRKCEDAFWKVDELLIARLSSS
jgi:hypothetical protein